jgi:hypothetical protein
LFLGKAEVFRVNNCQYRWLAVYLAVMGLWASVAWGKATGTISAPTLYTGMSDASAAVAIGTNYFVVCDDESNELRVYPRDRGGAPIKTYDFSRFVGIEPMHPEADWECAARVGDLVYWMSSQGRNRAGKERWNRHFFFAVKIQESNGAVEFSPVGRPYHDLINDLIADSRLAGFHLAEAARKPPKDPQALNIEGIAATPDQKLLIGFRNPIPGSKALVVPLENPRGIIQGERARLGAPMLLNLDGLGIRDIALFEDRWLIIGGPSFEGGGFKLFQWAGSGAEPKHLKHLKMKDLHPEAIVFYPDKGWSEFQLLNDDGSRKQNGVANKDLPFSRRQFRAVWVEP